MIRQQDNLRGILLMATGMFCFSAVDTMGKLLTDTLHPVQIVWFRQLGLVLGVIVFVILRGVWVLKSAHPALQISRGVFAAGSATLFIFAVTYLAIADAVAISFVAPFFVTVMGALILKEPVGIRRWSAVLIGFVGTLIVIRPGLGVMHPAAFLVLAAAFLFALRQILSRTLATADATATTVAYTALVSWGLLSLALPFYWETPATSREILLLLGMATIGGVAEVLVIKALEVGQAVAIAPVHYSLMIWGVMYGYLVFAQLPDAMTWVGAIIIMASGLYTVHRERQVQRSKLLER